MLISDVDEIPNLSNEIFLKYDSVIFLQKMFYYKLNIFCYDGLKWNKKWAGTKSCKFKFFKNAQSVREFRVKNYPWWRFDRKIKRYIEQNGGWHFAYLMNTKDISKKISGFTHELSHVLNSDNFNIEALSDQNCINQKIENLNTPDKIFLLPHQINHFKNCQHTNFLYPIERKINITHEEWQSMQK